MEVRKDSIIGHTRAIEWNRFTTCSSKFKWVGSTKTCRPANALLIGKCPWLSSASTAPREQPNQGKRAQMNLPRTSLCLPQSPGMFPEIVRFPAGGFCSSIRICLPVQGCCTQQNKRDLKDNRPLKVRKLVLILEMSFSYVRHLFRNFLHLSRIRFFHTERAAPEIICLE